MNVLAFVLLVTIIPAILVAFVTRGGPFQTNFSSFIKRFGDIRQDLQLGLSAGITFASEFFFIFTKRISFVHRLENTVKRHGDEEALIFLDRKYTWKQLDQKSNQVANWLIDQGVEPGKGYVCLFMENSDLFIITWLGILKAGCTAAFINSNLKQDILIHALETSTGNLVVTDEAGMEALNDLKSKLKKLGFSWHLYNDIPLDQEPTTPPNVNLPSIINTKSTAILVYTSGTTGASKAAKVSHLRWFVGCSMFRWMTWISSKDRYYVCLPLYHSSAAMLVVGQCLLSGACIIVSKKFSASNFFKDCVKYKATMFQYVGELARYLLATPPGPQDTQHSIRMAVGNGLRKDVWHTFKTRFNLPAILEFYGASESINMVCNLNTSIVGEGAVGHRGLLGRVFDRNLRIIKYNVDLEEPIRQNGFCIDADFDEPGELLNCILSWDPARQFAGYHANEKATNKKIYRDVFKKGDAWFASGDLVRLTEDGYYWFEDRIGDTFRWKGENTSTTEVENAILSTTLAKNGTLSMCNVYGVEVVGMEGRAGCAALVLNDHEVIDWSIFAQELIAKLPRFAVPVFVRILDELPTTTTMKLPKVQLKSEGVSCSMHCMVLLAGGKSFVPLTEKVWNGIKDGSVKV